MSPTHPGPQSSSAATPPVSFSEFEGVGRREAGGRSSEKIYRSRAARSFGFHPHPSESAGLPFRTESSRWRAHSSGPAEKGGKSFSNDVSASVYPRRRQSIYADGGREIHDRQAIRTSRS